MLKSHCLPHPVEGGIFPLHLTHHGNQLCCVWEYLSDVNPQVRLQRLRAKQGGYGYRFTVFGMTWLEIKPTVFQSQDGHSATGPLRAG